MPHFPSVKSLEDLSLENVMQNLDSLWCKHYMDTFYDQGNYLYVLGPFETITSQLVSKLFSLLRDKKLLRRHHLDLLLVSHLDHLDLSRDQSLVGNALSLVAKRCPASLKSLDLSYCQKIPSKVYQECFPCLTKLQKLSLRGTNCTDSTLFILGAYCPDLQDLDLNSCSSISDLGLKSLCVPQDDLGNPSDRFGQCSKLRKLLLIGSKVSETGICVALENLPHLKVLECSLSITAIANKHRMAWETGKDTLQYQLVDLYYDHQFAGVYNPLSLPVAIGACPNVVKVSLLCSPSVRDEDLLALLHLAQLRELQIGGGDETLVSFANGILPVLQAHPHLQALQIGEIAHVNLEMIASLCKELSVLHLITNDGYDVRWPDGLVKPKCVLPLPLRYLNVVCMTNRFEDSDVPASHLKYLLGSGELNHVYLREVYSLTDEIVTELLKSNQFPKLEHLEMEYCNSLTIGGILPLLELKNPLKALKLWNCKNVMRRDFDLLKSLVREKKWQLNLEWM